MRAAPPTVEKDFRFRPDEGLTRSMTDAEDAAVRRWMREQGGVYSAFVANLKKDPVPRDAYTLYDTMTVRRLCGSSVSTVHSW